MEDAHLSLEMMAKLLSGGIEQDDLQTQVVPHFLALCPVCRDRCRQVRRLQEEVGHWNEEVAVFEGQEAPELWKQLEGLTFEEQVKRVDEEEGLHTWGLCQLLLKRSAEAGFGDPSSAIDLANLAVKISGRLGEAYDPNWVWDLRARSFAYLGNARRIAGELRSAEDAFYKVDKCLAQSSTGDKNLLAEVLRLKSSLKRAQRQFEVALDLADDALQLYGEIGDLRGVGICRLKKAKILEEMGELKSAIELLSESSEETDTIHEPRLLAYTRYNLLGCLTLAERYEEAERLLPGVEQLFGALGQPLDLVRLSWARANIALGLGDLRTAEETFDQVRREFAARGMSYDVALVSLDLALLYHQEGRAAELKRLTSELLTIFEAQEIHREALGAFYLFQTASLEERLTVDIITRLAEVLRRYRPGNGV